MIYQKERGMTLIELLIAMLILLVGIVPLMRVFSYELYVMNRANKMVIATNLARDMAEEIRSNYFSEEYVNFNSNAYKNVWPYDTSNPQSFGLDTGENQTTSPGNGRIYKLDDVDDYDGWCRGSGCGDSSIVETFDGYPYDGTGNYPDYQNFITRRVRVRNVFPIEAFTYERNPFESGSQIQINRYEFENWSALRIDDDGDDATGISALKIIEITVTISGLEIADQEVKDISFAAMPITTATGMTD